MILHTNVRQNMFFALKIAWTSCSCCYRKKHDGALILLLRSLSPWLWVKSLFFVLVTDVLWCKQWRTNNGWNGTSGHSMYWIVTQAFEKKMMMVKMKSVQNIKCNDVFVLKTITYASFPGIVLVIERSLLRHKDESLVSTSCCLKKKN
eukprot:m.196328 g.196328  ORF g.196328 m.196328 type:complete len:148 (-) comp13675_c0_seq5:545-988(-)